MKKIAEYLGDQTEHLLLHTCDTIDKTRHTLPGPNYQDLVFLNSNRNHQVLNALAR